MGYDVEIIVFNIVGQPSIAPHHWKGREIRDYVRSALDYGFSDAEIARDLAERWPSPRARVEVDRVPGGPIRVIFAPSWPGSGLSTGQ